MDPNTRNQIENIIQNLDFEGANLLRVKGGKMIYQFTHPAGAEPSDLLEGLTNVIYSEFYASGNFEETPSATYQDRLAYVDQLRTANNTKEKLNRGWKIESVMPDGKIHVIKGNYRQQVNSGDYVRSSMGLSIAKGSEISIFQYREYDNNEEVFFYIFGETMGETAAPGLIRLYFNAKPEGGVALVKNISTYFNRYKIPFQFKCLNQPAFYNRTDSAVLYLSKNYADFAMEIMMLFYQEIKPLLNEEIPYFTKLLAPGISFAENPFKEKESFGQSRSRLIAEAIIEAHDLQLPKTEWMNKILQNIEMRGFNSDYFYLNPHSKYPYQFPVFG